MKKLVSAIFIVSISLPLQAQEVYSINVNRVCSTIVGIPYASDNFSDEEWRQFQECVSFMKSYQQY
jgi:hypothetical protein